MQAYDKEEILLPIAGTSVNDNRSAGARERQSASGHRWERQLLTSST